ncbi:thymidylate kinase [Streptomyces phage GirlPower]|nr:thymidylate kinase [Streptomyces phage GirlPower]
MTAAAKIPVWHTVLNSDWEPIYTGHDHEVVDWLRGHNHLDFRVARVRIGVNGQPIPVAKYMDTIGSQYPECVTEPETNKKDDGVNHPEYYNKYPVEVIDLIEEMPFNRGSVIKYVARAGLKHPDTELQDLMKAQFYINREIDRIKARAAKEGNR